MDTVRSIQVQALSEEIGRLAGDLARAEWAGSRVDDAEKQAQLRKLVTERNKLRAA